jgi:hypothetical protein
MSFGIIISKVNNTLISSFAVLDGWFDQSNEFLYRKPIQDEWSPAEILEHVMLTNHFLLKLIDKGSRRALEIANETDFSSNLVDYQLEAPLLQEVGQSDAFTWNHPSHMTPTGLKPLGEVRKELREQLFRCLCHLELLANGEGTTHKITMSVNGIGKMDVYQYLYFLALHIKRHLTQLEKHVRADIH